MSRNGSAKSNKQPATEMRERSAEEVQRHEAHLVGQIYHLIEVNRKLEEQLDRLGKVTEIADLFREKGISRDTFTLPKPKTLIPAHVQLAWSAVEDAVNELPKGTEGLIQLKDNLGVVRATDRDLSPDWLADVQLRMVAAEQAIAFLDETTRDLDLLMSEKNNIMDGVGRLEQTIEDLWKGLNEKTTHIQSLEKQIDRIWNRLPYRVLSALRRPFRRRKKS
jgi:predicted RNase H-like nuclease (RuvC/YqgF family)